MSDNNQRKLRLMTYMSPGIPLGLYQTYQYCLEEALGVESFLIVESRHSGPPANKIDPFTSDEIDIGFMCSTSYLRMSAERNPNIELLPAAPIHDHPKSELRPVYFADIIVNTDKDETKYKEFKDLKGHKWAYNGSDSLSGSVSVLTELKRMGTNTSFFGHTLHSGSHLNSIQLVLTNTVDCAAIDSNVLSSYLREHPHQKEKLRILTSLGPFPTPPVVCNKRLPAEVKQKISSALLQINKVPKWATELQKYGVWGFKPIDESLYDAEKEIKETAKSMSVQAVYY